MLFNSAIFPFFLAVALLLYYASAFQLRLQNVVLVLLSCCVASCIRRPNCAFNRLSSSVLSSSALATKASLVRISLKKY